MATAYRVPLPQPLPLLPSPDAMDRKPILSARQIEGLVAQGQTIVIYAGHALRLDCWLDRHPGGLLPIQHMVGRDATSEINAYHSHETLRRMNPFCIGKVRLPWANLTPPIRNGFFRPYNELSDGDSDPEPPTNACDRAPNDNTCCFKRKEKGTFLLKAPTCAASGKSATRTRFIDALEQEEIHNSALAYPAPSIETQEAISREYSALHERIKDEGFYNCRYAEYGKDSIRWMILFAAFVYLLHVKWYLTSAILLGMFWQQIMFVAHDAGHRGITGNFVADTLIGAFVADFCCGLSIGWWKASHNVHHLVTNMPEHDPDIQNVPLFATSPSFFKSLLSSFYDFTFVWDASADFLVQYQVYMYYPIMALARFNLYFLSWIHLLSKRSQNLGSARWTRFVEIAFMGCYWTIFGYGLVLRTLPDWPTRVAFVLISHSITLLLHVQITLSHWGMSTADLGPGESFPQRQLRTTMDVDCPPWLDFLHGGLQFQAVHHLFPRVPRHNLRSVQTLVREFCDKTQIEYQCYGFVKGNTIVLSRLEEVAKMADALLQCQMHMAKTGDGGLH